jgi:hypothetical protein
MTRRTIEIIPFCAALLAAALAIHAWLQTRADQQRLQSTLADQKRILDSSDASERARDNTLAATLAQIANLKRTTQTPEQVLRNLPKYLSLPQPITLVGSESPSNAQSQQGTALPEKSEGATSSPDDSKAASGRAASSSSLSNARSRAPEGKPSSGTSLPIQLPAPCKSADDCAAQIPAADLKPLYDYVQDCRACQAQLAVAKQNQTDDAAKIAALTRERDAAVTAAKGGTFWRRARRNAIWFAVGAGLGAAGGYAASVRH